MEASLSGPTSSSHPQLINHDSLLDEIYFASMRPTAWNRVLAQIGAAIDADSGLMMVPASFGASAMAYAAYGMNLPPEVADFYSQMIGRATLTNLALATGRAPGVFDLSELFPILTRGANEFWNRIIEPMKWTEGYVCILRLPREAGGPPVIMNFFRDGSRASRLAQNRRKVLETLFPHLRRSLDLALSVGPVGDITGSLSQFLDAVVDAAVILNSESRILAVNPAAEAFFSGSGEISGRDGVFSFRDTERQAMLLGWLTSGAARWDARGDFVTITGDTDAPVYVSISPLGATFGADTSTSAPRVLVRMVSGMSGPSEGAVRSFRDFFGLTNSEMEIATALGAGHSAEYIASQRGTTVGTVRLQIRSILQKTNTSRQSAVTSLVARLCR